LQRLSDTNILLVGLGGVGSFAAEFLARAGVGHMTVVDGDSVDTTNRNRQLPALHSTVGQLKAHVVAQRLQDINPQLHLTVKQVRGMEGQSLVVFRPGCCGGPG
jgi:tRNA A37 threonylcarbamoyladenosine dehydratase